MDVLDGALGDLVEGVFAAAVERHRDSATPLLPDGRYRPVILSGRGYVLDTLRNETFLAVMTPDEAAHMAGLMSEAARRRERLFLQRRLDHEAVSRSKRPLNFRDRVRLKLAGKH